VGKGRESGKKPTQAAGMGQGEGPEETEAQLPSHRLEHSDGVRCRALGLGVQQPRREKGNHERDPSERSRSQPRNRGHG